MKPSIAKIVLASGLLLTSLGSTVGAAQPATEHSCCLAEEWRLPAETVSPQSSGDFCCVALEWQADPTETPMSRIESAVQSDKVSCCLAREWDAS